MRQTTKDRREYNAEWYQANKAKRREYDRAWRAANREKLREYQLEYNRAWRAANRDKRRASQRANYEATKDRRRASTIQRKYGLTAEQWDALFVAQGSACANPSCRVVDPGSRSGWHTDHCHSTGKVRGILCHGCNVAVGHAKDQPTVLRGLADYLEQSDTGETNGE